MDMRFFVLFALIGVAVSEHVLFMTPMGSKSHKIFYMSIAKALAQRGHHVTMVSAFEPSEEIGNITEVVIEDFSLNSEILSNVFDDTRAGIKNLFMKAPAMCSDTLAQPQVQSLRKEHFDIAILSMFFGDCYLSMVHHFKIPFIYAFPAGLMGFFHDMVGNIEFPSLAHSKPFDFKFPLTFSQRAMTILINNVMGLISTYYVDYNFESVCRSRGLCPPDMPPFSEIRKNVSLALINSVQTLEQPPRPVMPNVIHAGGAHIKPPKPLPKDIEEWVQGSGDDGFIFFSIGSALPPSLLPEKYRQILIKVFGSLKQRVLWKWDEDTMPDLPKNVKLGKWFPQPDILGHPKLRLFITHGGLLSTLESTYNGIPIIGMPVFADQFSNMKEVETDGWGKVMQWKTLQENSFRKLIEDTITDKSLRERSKQRSALMQDTPMAPDDKAAYWVEYVLRHKGAPHIMSPIQHMRWYQVYNLDVYAFFFGVFLVIVYVFGCLTKFCLRLCGIIGKSEKSKKKRD